MEYDLAKSLKDAGFPQDLKDKEGLVPEDWYRDGKTWDETSKVICYVPTLEELIEAIGPDFNTLCQQDESLDKWVAISDLEDIFEGGATPTEAIAKLWLALNKKV